MIEIEGLRKTFRVNDRRARWWQNFVGSRPEKTIVALDALSLTVAKGNFYSLLGANGAGKTTTMKILCTLLLPDAGRVHVAGFDVVRQSRQVRERLGVSIRGERSVYWKLTGRQNLDYFTSLSGYRGREARSRVESVIEIIGLASRIDDYVERYSMGMKQRLAIGCALVHNPPVLLLDEPTIGLDPHAARALRHFIHDELCRQQGVTVLYTTHYMHEAEELSDQIAILHGGRIVAQGTPAAVQAGVADRQVLQLQARHLTESALAAVRDHSAVASVSDSLGHDDIVTINVTLRNGDLPVSELIERVTTAGASLVGVQVLRPSLEDAFVALTGTSVSDTGEPVAVNAS